MKYSARAGSLASSWPLADGGLRAAWDTRRGSLAVALVEGWRGEVCHVALTDYGGRLRSYKIVDPSFHNWMGLAVALRGRRSPISRSATRASTSPTAAPTSDLTMFVFDTIAHRLKLGRETMAYPDGPAPALPDRHGGSLRVDSAKCPEGCRECAPVCPTEAITPRDGGGIRLDLGRCLFCSACVEACPHGAVTPTNDHRMAVRRREDLILGEPGREELRLAAALEGRLLPSSAAPCACAR